MSKGDTMNLNAPELMEPVFRFLDGLVAEYGLYAYMVMVWASPLVIVWILRGGLRRKSSRRNSGMATHIIIIQPPVRPPPLAATSHQGRPGFMFRQ
jgi:hypothetical protein